MPALCEPLRVRKDDPDLLGFTFREQAVLDFDNYFSNYNSLVFKEEIKGDSYGTFDGVFYRDYRDVCISFYCSQERILYICEVPKLCIRQAIFQGPQFCSPFRIRAFWPHYTYDHLKVNWREGNNNFSFIRKMDILK